jgi:hypothetical protein
MSTVKKVRKAYMLDEDEDRTRRSFYPTRYFPPPSNHCQGDEFSWLAGRQLDYSPRTDKVQVQHVVGPGVIMTWQYYFTQWFPESGSLIMTVGGALVVRSVQLKLWIGGRLLDIGTLDIPAEETHLVTLMWFRIDNDWWMGYLGAGLLTVLPGAARSLNTRFGWELHNQDAYNMNVDTVLYVEGGLYK